MKLDLSGHVVIVTGGGRGIGRVIAETFAREGSVAIAFDLQHEARIPGVEQVRCDVTDALSVREAVAAVVEKHGRIDAVINNAGINAEGKVDEIAGALWDRAFDVNVKGVFHMCRAVIPYMKAQEGGRIINAASFAAIIPSVGAAAYGASKAAVVQLSRVLASELGPWGITVNSYAPGMIPTAMNGFAELDDAGQGERLDQLSIRRWGTADDVAKLLCFLASGQSEYITGALIDVSGGKFSTQMPGAAYT